MSMPKIPDMNPDIVIDRNDAVNAIITSIAMEELALAHILNAEGEKLQYFLGTLNGSAPGDIMICDILEVNISIQKTLRDVLKTEMLLQLKLEDAVELLKAENQCQTTVSGQIIWRDGNNVAGTRPPSVKITLLRDGNIYRSVTVDSMGDGAFTFACLPAKASATRKYIYEIDETVVPAGYAKSIDGFNIINTAEAGEMTIDGSKIWVDNDDAGDARPTEITINLLQNGNQIRTIQVTSPVAPDNTAPFRFSNVPRFDHEGTPFVYTVDESAVPGYVKDVTGFTIRNTPQ